MTNAQKLKNLIENEVLPEIEESIDYLFELVNNKQATSEDKEELKVTQDLLKAFNEILVELENNEIDEEECLQIIEEIEEMRSYDEDDL
ncbi:MAG: hypothetical protein ACOX39_02940 [Arcobacteraceae bacterium]|jgi:microcompartment protein CcmL/EutN|nr:hypothetical protein [Arcobacteraceae bacterium]